MTIQLLKVAKFYRRLYGVEHKLALHHTNVCKFLQLCSTIIFARLKALFPVVLMDFP